MDHCDPVAVVASLAAVIMLTRGSNAGESTQAQSTEAPERIKLVVSAEGFPASLEAAVATVRENGTIYIPAGTYALDASVTLSKPVHLLGDSRGKTVIESTVAKTGLLVDADGFGAEGITFRHSGTKAGGIVTVHDAEVRIVDCRFVGADKKPHWWYEALWLKGSSTGYVRDCLFDENELGIGISGESTVSLETCRFQRNGQAGIAIYGAAKPSIVRNICTDSNGSGILVWEAARPVLNSNRCTGNENGIACSEKSRPRIEDNRCSNNLEDGIVIYGHSRATVSGNVCQNNRENGITGNDHAVVRIEDNTTTGNRGVGIGFWGSATGRITGNKVTQCGTGNSGGICIGGHANLLIEDNWCEYDKQYGILFRDSGTGTVRDNYCSHCNYGILDNSSKSPTISGNDLEWNSTANISRY